MRIFYLPFIWLLLLLAAAPAFAAPLLTSISPSSGSAGTPLTLRGSGFSNATLIDFVGDGILRANFTVVSDTEIRAAVPASTMTGYVTVKDYTGATNGGVYFTFIPPSTPPIILRVWEGGGPQTATQGVYNDAIYPGAIVNIKIAGPAGASTYGITGVSFNGAIVPASDIYFYTDFVISVKVPLNATPGQVFLTTQSLGNSSSLRYYFPRPQYPCSGVEICGDQCIEMGTKPAPLLGRLIADKNGYTRQQGDAWAIYNYYYNTVHYFNEAPFADGQVELEQVQWQYSYDQNNWHDIQGAIYRDYQPDELYQTMYYRRSSTHQIFSYWRRDYIREHWYDSNTITIRMKAPAPTPAQSNFVINNCGGASAAVQARIYASWASTSYTWRMPYNGNWTINGQPAGSGYTTTDPYVTVACPANTSLGNYPLLVSATGVCGGASRATWINIKVSQDPPAAPSSIGYRFTYTSDCYGYYDAVMPLIDGATSYSATDDSGYSFTPEIIPSQGIVLFGTGFYGGGTYTIHVSATNNCGTSQIVDDTQTLTDPSTWCRQSGAAAGALKKDDPSKKASPAQQVDVFPSPASEELTITTGGAAGQVVLYDVQGRQCRSVQLQEGQAQQLLNVHDLADGVYQIQILSKGKLLFGKRILVMH